MEAIGAMDLGLGGERAEQGAIGAGEDRDARAGESAKREGVAELSRSGTLPPQTVTARTSSSGEAKARRSAKASSAPGSQSMMTGRGMAGRADGLAGSHGLQAGSDIGHKVADGRGRKVFHLGGVVKAAEMDRGLGVR
jgi:hypothetical protein